MKEADLHSVFSCNIALSCATIQEAYSVQRGGGGEALEDLAPPQDFFWKKKD